MSDLENLEFHVPANKDTLDFLKRSGNEKMRIISLGLKCYSMGIQKMQAWDNEEWNQKLETARKQHEATIAEKDTKLVAAEKRFRLIQQQHRNELDTIKQQVKEQMSSLYSTRIRGLECELERKDTKIQAYSEKNQQLYKQAYNEFKKDLNEMEEKYENKLTKMQTHYEDKLALEKIEKENLITRTQNSTIIGQDGEEIIKNELTLLFPSAEIEDTHKESGRGDLILKDKEFTMLVEIKNYTKNVPKPEIDKFDRDMNQNQDIDCGILISLKSGIAAKDDFTLEVSGGKPMLFLHNVKKNPQIIQLAVVLFKLILKNDSIDLSCKEIYGKLKNIIPVVKRNFKNQIKALDKYRTQQIKLIAEQESNIINIFNIMTLKY